MSVTADYESANDIHRLHVYLESKGLDGETGSQSEEDIYDN